MTFSFFSQIVNDRKKFFFFNRKKAILECFKTNNACCSVIFISFCCLLFRHDVILTTTFLHSKIHNSSRNIYKNVAPIFFSFLQRKYHNFQYTIANSDVVYRIYTYTFKSFIFDNKNFLFSVTITKVISYRICKWHFWTCNSFEQQEILSEFINTLYLL